MGLVTLACRSCLMVAELRAADLGLEGVGIGSIGRRCNFVTEGQECKVTQAVLSLESAVIWPWSGCGSQNARTVRWF